MKRFTVRPDGTGFLVYDEQRREPCDWPTLATREEAEAEARDFERSIGELESDERSEARGLAMMEGRLEELDEPEWDPGQVRPCPGHEWSYSGTAYGGDDESYFGEGRCYCMHCGADGDA